MNVVRAPHHHARHSFSIVLGLLLILLAPPLTTRAESLDLTAKVNAPLPTSPALITSLTDQQRFSTASVVISGTCDGAYVVLYLNGTASGTGVCTDGGFSIQLSLVPGANQLQIKIYNSTDNEGPTSPVIIVYYDPPRSEPLANIPPVFIAPEGVATPSDATTIAPKELSIGYTPQPYRVYQLHEPWQGEVSIHGGTLPYITIIDWDDKTQARDIRDSSGSFLITHTFTKAGNYQPVVYVEDKNGLTRSLQFLIVVVEPAMQKDTSTTTQSSLIPVLVATTLGVAVIGALMVQLGNILGLLASMIKPSGPKG